MQFEEKIKRIKMKVSKLQMTEKLMRLLSIIRS